jgi:ABC-2 type transport system permease protein
VTSTATAVALSPSVDQRPAPRPEAAITRRAFRQLWKSAAVVGVVFGATAAASALSYVSTFPNAASRADLAASLSGDSGFTMLFGQVNGIGTVGGYTVYKTYVFLTTIGAIWAALAVTRLLRGEEDTGRWQLVLAGRTSPARATAATIAALGAAVGVVFVGTTVLTMAAGASPDVGFSARDSVMYGLSVAAAPAVFGSLAVVCSQLAQTRRLATTLSMVVLAAAFVLRMLGDASPSSSWLLWTTPLGWIEEMQPFTANNAWPLVPALVLTGLAGWAGVGLASRRDVGAGAFASNETADLRSYGLRTPLGLATRLSLPVLVAWGVGLIAVSFIFGTVAKAAAGALTGSSVTSTLSNLGAGGSGANQYLGVVFLLIGAVLALVPASQIGATRDEEASGRLGQVLAGPPSRTSWLTGRLVLAGGAVVVMGLLSGASAWAGARSQGVDTDFGSLLIAGINVVPSALLALAVGAITFAVLPRFAAAAVYTVVAWSLIIDLLGSLVTSLDWLTRLSIFHYVALAPADDPDWTAVAVITAIALGLAVASVAIFNRRDLAPD